MYKRATRYPSIRPSIHADRHPSVALTLLLLPRYQEGRTAFWVAAYADNHQALSALLRFSTSIKPSDKVCLASAFCPQPPSLIRCVCVAAPLVQTELLEWAIAHGRLMVGSHAIFSGAFVSHKSVRVELPGSLTPARARADDCSLLAGPEHHLQDCVCVWRRPQGQTDATQGPSRSPSPR